MTDLAARAGVGVPTGARPKLDGFGNIKSIIIFGGLVAAALLYVVYSLYVDVADSGAKTTTFLPYLLLFVALLIALGLPSRIGPGLAHATSSSRTVSCISGA